MGNNQLELKKQKTILQHMATREERHGPEELVLCVDLKFKADVSNDFLSTLDPGLKSSLYEKPDRVDLASDANHMPVLRFPFLAPLKWTQGLVAAAVTIHGPKKAADLSFAAKVNNIGLECKEGGTVTLTYRVQTPVTPEQVGALSGMLSREIKVSIVPSDAEPSTDAGDDTQEE